MRLKRAEIVDTAFQRVEVWKSNTQAEFRVAGAIHAWWHQDKYLTGLAWDIIAAGCLLRPSGPPRSILMIGLAGGTAFRILRQLLPQVELVAIDIDPKIVALAREHMHLEQTGIEVHLADAYEWMHRCKRRFDVIIDDAYLAGADDVFRPDGWNEDAIGTLKGLLNPGGLLLANLVTGHGHRAMQSRTRKSFHSAFPVVRSVTTPGSMNEVLVGGDEVFSQSSLDQWRVWFSARSDRGFWSEIRVKKLSGAMARR